MISRLGENDGDFEAVAAELQQRCAAWRMAKFPTSTPEGVLAKLLEEAGEFARAVIGEVEGRSGRGDVHQEGAQTILVVLSIIGQWYPGRNVLVEVLAELHRHETELELARWAE